MTWKLGWWKNIEVTADTKAKDVQSFSTKNGREVFFLSFVPCHGFFHQKLQRWLGITSMSSVDQGSKGRLQPNFSDSAGESLAQHDRKMTLCIQTYMMAQWYHMIQIQIDTACDTMYSNKQNCEYTCWYIAIIRINIQARTCMVDTFTIHDLSGLHRKSVACPLPRG